jgi:hypothetical protein
MIRREFAEGVPGRGTNVGQQGFLRDSPYCCAVREERRLRVLRCGELLGWALEAEATQIGTKCGIDFPEDSLRNGIGFREVFPHAGLL